MKRIFLYPLLLGAALQSQTLLRTYTVNNLPAASTQSGVTVFVQNGSSATDCTVGGGLYLVPCKSNGTIWSVQSTGSGGGGTITGPGSVISGDIVTWNTTTSISDSLKSFQGTGNFVPLTTGTLINNNCIKSDVNHNLVDAGAPCGSGSMVYPGAGIPLSTGSAWGTSYTAVTGQLLGTGQSNTITTGLFDITLATGFKIPQLAGASSVNGDFRFNTSIGQYEGYGGGARWEFPWVAFGGGTASQCAYWISAYNLGSQACGSGSSPLTTKGDIFTFSTVNARLPIGANGTVLTADSTQSTGLSWVAPASGTGTLVFTNIPDLTCQAADSGATITTTGATLSAGAPVSISPPSTFTGSYTYRGIVTATNTVTVIACNMSGGGSPLTLTSATWTASAGLGGGGGGGGLPTGLDYTGNVFTVNSTSAAGLQAKLAGVTFGGGQWEPSGTKLSGLWPDGVTPNVGNFLIAMDDVASGGEGETRIFGLNHKIQFAINDGIPNINQAFALMCDNCGGGANPAIFDMSFNGGFGVKVGESTVANLPPASSNSHFTRGVIDALSPSLGAAVTGGGAVFCHVTSDGTNWNVADCAGAGGGSGATPIPGPTGALCQGTGCSSGFTNELDVVPSVVPLIANTVTITGAWTFNQARATKTTFAAITVACSSGTEGMIAAITDSNTNTWGATIAGGGTNHVLGYCDGTNLTVMGK